MQARLLLVKTLLFSVCLVCASPSVSASVPDSMLSVVPVSATSSANAGPRVPGYLGIEFHEVPTTSFGVLRLHSSRQMEIVMVDHDGPAGKAGLRAHDLVLSLNGQPLSGAAALRRMIHEGAPGTSISLSVLRGGQSLTVTAQLETREDVERRAWAHVTTADTPLGESETLDENEVAPAPSMAPGAPRSKHFFGEILHGPYTGLQLQVLPPQLGGFFGAPTKMGLLVQSVEPGSPAAVSGLEAGDVLLRADTLALHTLNDWNRRLHAAKGRAMHLSLLRDHHEISLLLQPESGRSSLDWPKLF